METRPKLKMLDPEYHKKRYAYYDKISREYKNNVKLSIGCQRCGYNEYACALDFDHINSETKVRDIAKIHGIEAIKAEIAKCIVLCANCHRIVTHVPGERIKLYERIMEEGDWSA